MHSLKLLIILYFFLYPFSLTYAKTSFIVAGHLYPVVHDKILMERLFNKFDSLNPDYIFILGDSSLQKEQIYSYFYNRFKEKIYFSPGNNEVINGSLSKYKENVGYTNNIIESNDVNFILLNSLDNIENIKNFLSNAVNKDTHKNQILLTHHRIWDDTLLSEYPYQHDKSYYFNELYPLISGKISAIFSGNSKRQYFSDYKETKSKQNVNNIYWVDQIGDIDCYSIGTGDGKPRLGFVYVESINNRLIVKPHNINSEKIEPIPIGKIKMEISSFKKSIPEKNIFLKVKAWIDARSNIKLLFLGIGIGGAIGLMLGFYTTRKVKK